MLESIDIRNYQPHTKQTIPIEPGVTVIMGPSDSGKSSLIRALEWWCLNETGDPDFINWDAKFCRVTGKIDGKTITRLRKRTAGTNVYKIGSKQYAAVRTSVPEPVSAIINMSEVNFQGQHDSAFWLADTPGNVSKQLNKIVNLDLIDSSLARIGARVRRHKSGFRINRERNKESRKRVHDLSWVVEAHERYSRVEETQGDVKQLELLRSTLEKTIGDLETINHSLDDSVEMLDQALKVEAKFKEVRKLERQVQILDDIVMEYDRHSKLGDVPDLTEVTEKAFECQVLEQKLDQLDRLILQFDNEKEVICLLQTKLQTTLSKLEEIPKCPVCGKPTT